MTRLDCGLRAFGQGVSTIHFFTALVIVLESCNTLGFPLEPGQSRSKLVKLWIHWSVTPPRLLVFWLLRLCTFVSERVWSSAANTEPASRVASCGFCLQSVGLTVAIKPKISQLSLVTGENIFQLNRQGFEPQAPVYPSAADSDLRSHQWRSGAASLWETTGCIISILIMKPVSTPFCSI